MAQYRPNYHHTGRYSRYRTVYSRYWASTAMFTGTVLALYNETFILMKLKVYLYWKMAQYRPSCGHTAGF